MTRRMRLLTGFAVAAGLAGLLAYGGENATTLSGTSPVAADPDDPCKPEIRADGTKVWKFNGAAIEIPASGFNPTFTIDGDERSLVMVKGTCQLLENHPVAAPAPSPHPK